jgi:hypothetical protein
MNYHWRAQGLGGDTKFRKYHRMREEGRGCRYIRSIQGRRRLCCKMAYLAETSADDMGGGNDKSSSKQHTRCGS